MWLQRLTTLAGARLQIEEPQARGHCRQCGTDFAKTDMSLLYPGGSADVAVVSRREVNLVSMEVA